MFTTPHPQSWAVGPGSFEAVLKCIKTKDFKARTEAKLCRAVYTAQKTPRTKNRCCPPFPKSPLQPTGVPGAQKPCEQQPAGMASLSAWTSWGYINAWSSGEKTDSFSGISKGREKKGIMKERQLVTLNPSLSERFCRMSLTRTPRCSQAGQ